MVGATDAGSPFDAWGWMCILGGGMFGLPKGKKAPSRLLPAPAARSGGDCGPDTAAWLLNEHGPALYRSRSPETCASVRRSLMQAWEGILRADVSGDDGQAFVQQRLEQVPQAMAEETLDQQVALTLEALLRGEKEIIVLPKADEADVTVVTPGFSEGDLNKEGLATIEEERCILPYWFLPTDWARLAEAYQVDFVLHGLPGSEGCHCSHCGCSGHVHVGPRSPGLDLCLHVGWRGGASKKSSSSQGADKDRDNAWGHWEPLGSGPIKAPLPLPRRQSTINSDLEPNSALYEVSLNDADNVDSTAGQDLLHASWAMAGLNCTPLSSCTPAACQPTETNAPQSRLKCPKLKDCCDTERRVSDDGVGDVGNALSDKHGAVATINSSNQADNEATATVCAQPVVSIHSSRSSGSGAGARFSVMLEGRSLFEGVDLEDTSPLRQADAAAGGSAGVAQLNRFREAFIEAVSAAACISPSRVRILDIGLPFEAHVLKNALRLAKAAAATTNATPQEALSTPTKERSIATHKEPDTGAGVLRFLSDDGAAPHADSALSPPPDANTTPSPTNTSDTTAPPATPPPRTAPTPWQTPAEEDALTPPRPDPAPAAGTNHRTASGTIRVLAVLREPKDASVEIEQPGAMMALELVVAELANPKSTLQQTLRDSIDEKATRIWCPEAEGPHKGPHQAGAAMRARHVAAWGNVARLQQAKRTR